jgi:hypothetical protein
MHVRRRHHLNLLLPMLLCVAALTIGAGVAAAPASAGVITGNVSDQFDNPLEGMLVEALDSVTGVPFASGTTGGGAGDFGVEMVSPPTGTFKVRVSDPAGVFTTSYLLGHSSFEDGDLYGYT